jgi:hypothetical protein
MIEKARQTIRAALHLGEKMEEDHFKILMQSFSRIRRLGSGKEGREV